MIDAHPLFPAKSPDEEPPEVVTIFVRRDGKTWPRPFLADELQSLEQLAAEWGGGTYELIARNERHITTQVRYTIPGPALPFEPPGALPSQQAPATSAPAPMPAPVGAVGGSDVFAMVLGLMQQSNQTTVQMMLEMTRQNAATTQAMMQSQQATQLAHQREMAAMQERSSTRDAQMFAALIQSSRQTDPAAMFERGLQAALNLSGGGGDSDGDEASELGEIAGAIGQIAQGVGVFQQQAPAAPTPPAPGGEP